MKKAFSETFTKPGRYYFGDICYIMKEDLYYELWGNTYNFDDGSFVVPSIGERFAVGGTAYGDGSYLDFKREKSYEVDAWVLGIVPESMWDKEKYSEKLNEYASFITLAEKETLFFETDGDGAFCVTHISLKSVIGPQVIKEIIVDTSSEDE